MATFELFQALKRDLLQQTCPMQQYAGVSEGHVSLWDVYESVWRPFGQCLVEMEWKGMHLDGGLIKTLIAQSESEETEFMAAQRSLELCNEFMHCPVVWTFSLRGSTHVSPAQASI